MWIQGLHTLKTLASLNKATEESWDPPPPSRGGGSLVLRIALHRFLGVAAVQRLYALLQLRSLYGYARLVHSFSGYSAASLSYNALSGLAS